MVIMDCEGIVTGVNPVFLYFTLDFRLKIHISILLTQKATHKLPKIGYKVKITNAHREESTYSICKKSKLEGEFTLSYNKNFFYNLVNDYKLGFTDLLQIDHILDIFDRYYTSLSEDLKVTLIESVLQNVIKKLDMHYKDDVCSNKHMLSVHFSTVSMCRCIEIMPENNRFINFPNWSFGVHLHPKEGTLLFGNMKIQPGYGFLMLKDHQYQIPCIICNVTTNCSNSIANAYVLIKKYKVITEIYQENNIPNIEYFLIDFNDIDVIHKENNDVCLFGYAPPTNFENNINFQLIRKSMVCINNRSKPECWLQISTQLEGEIFLILPCHYIKIVTFFEEGHKYKLFHKETLKQVQNIELTRIKNVKIYELQEELAFFQRLNEAIETKKYLTVEGCKEYLLNNTDLVTFEGILKGRRFANPLPSRTKKRANIYGFGMPGSRIHQLVFSTNLNGSKVYLDCYLNNWENILMPLGLIPQMKLIVRNVYPQSKKYLKSSVFTSFEVVAYEPLVNFETVNLYENDSLQWGRPFHLGQGNKIPHGVLVWGTVCNIQVLSVKMENLCSKCKFASGNLDYCTNCQATEKDFNFLLKMHVSDEFGQSKVLTKYPDIMQVFLNLKQQQFEIWLKAFKEIGQYQYSLFEEIEAEDTVEEHGIFRRSLTEFLNTMNKYGMFRLDLKCRKLDCDSQKNGGRPLWFCVDARKRKSYLI